MTRLRRSLRGTAPPQLTKEDRYEKIINYVAQLVSGKHEPRVQRQFSMPSYILASAQGVLTTKTNPSALELLPTDILLDIVGRLEGNSQMMLALSCKTFASVVEASETRKIANLTPYITLSTGQPSLHAKDDGSTDAEFMRQGYMRPPRKPANPPEHYRCSHSQVAARHEQTSDLKAQIGKYLGPDYEWCHKCEMYRFLKKKWWTDFTEYETPGIMKQSNDTATKVKEAIDNWQREKDSKDVWVPRYCPAHSILQECNGKRVIMDEPVKPQKEKAKETTKKKQKAKPKAGRRRRWGWDFSYLGSE